MPFGRHRGRTRRSPGRSTLPRRTSGRGRAGLAWLLAFPAATVLGLALAVLPFGRPFLRLEAPAPGTVVGPEGLEVMVRFASGERVAPETFRVLLNGADVTESFTTGENGAVGRLHSLLDGENRLRAEVFGRSPLLPWLLVEQGHEVRVTHRRPLDLDRG